VKPRSSKSQKNNWFLAGLIALFCAPLIYDASRTPHPPPPPPDLAFFAARIQMLEHAIEQRRRLPLLPDQHLTIQAEAELADLEIELAELRRLSAAFRPD
jgi:hypothetical protein